MKRIILVLFIGTFNLYAPIDTKQIPTLLEDKDNLIHVAVIGSGPAGVAATINPARQGYHTVAFQGSKPLGALGDAKVVENWPAIEKASGADIMKKYEAQARSFNAHLVPLVVDKVDFSTWPYTLHLNDGTTVHALTVICATGSTQSKLNVEGEALYWGKGIFSCGLCDGSFARDKDTTIIGSGDIAVQRAIQLLPEARSITLIIAEPAMTAHKSMLEKINGIDKITILANKQVTRICGDEATLSHIELYDTVTKETTQFKTSSVFLSTGLTPNTELFKGKLPLCKDGCIELLDSRSQKTSIEGIMAAGTVSDPTYRQVAAITGDATKAGMDAMKCLSKWGFDSKRRSLGADRLYKPPVIPHPAIKHLITYAAFDRVLLQNKRPVVVELYSPECTACKKMEGPLTAVTEQYKDRIDFYKVDKEKLYDLVEDYDLNLIPAFLLFRNGILISRLEGETTLALLRALILKGLDPSTKPEALQKI